MHKPSRDLLPTKRKRVLTEDRKRQNRESQRRYRERRRATENQKPVSLAGAKESHLVQDEVNIDGLHLLSPSTPITQDKGQDRHLDPSFESTSLFPDFSFESILELSDFLGTSTPDSSIPLVATTNRGPSVPSPYTNYLQVQKHNFYAARVQNALYLGIPVQLAQKTESIISPWYWHKEFARLFAQQPSDHDSNYGASNLSNAHNPSKWDIFVRPVRRKPCFELSTIVMSDLAPTKLQQSHPHEMYIDMIPFPIFRDRIITLLSMNPPAFDESELQHDIESEGLLVWGVGNGTRDRTASLLRDQRNWECARWFAKKWRLLVSGSGLEEQSSWWRRMRGDEDSDDEGL